MARPFLPDFGLDHNVICKVCSAPIDRKPRESRSRWLRRETCGINCKFGGTASDERFWAKVDKSKGLGPNGDCWEWRGYRDDLGYGTFAVNGVHRKAHRIALFGQAERADERLACHRCDNPSCVRPDHLFAGSHADNTADMIAKGRDSGDRKLTPQAVLEIRSSQSSPNELAAIYGVTGRAIRDVRARRSWGHIL